MTWMAWIAGIDHADKQAQVKMIGRKVHFYIPLLTLQVQLEGGWGSCLCSSCGRRPLRGILICHLGTRDTIPAAHRKGCLKLASWVATSWL